MSQNGGVESGGRARAKQACKICNARRVRCNVVDMQPCSNCQSSKSVCEVLPSRRGRYPRKCRVQAARAYPTAKGTATAALSSPPIPAALQGINSPAEHVGQPSQHEAPLPSSGASGLFFGESNLLTCISETAAWSRPANVPDAEKNRLGYSTAYQLHAQDAKHDRAGKSNKERYLEAEGAFAFPPSKDCFPALRAYFLWFHPCFPILDRRKVAYQYSIGNLSPLLLQAMLFISATYCDEDTIDRMGFKDRLDAKSKLYNRAKILFEADWETDKLVTLQAVFLLSFWRGGSTNVKDVRCWLNIAVTIAQSCGFHRLARPTRIESKQIRTRRRIWWCIYIRDRQSSTSLGLPSHIMDEDCDVEVLSPSDFETDTNEDLAYSFEPTRPEHITYVIKMVEIAKLLGKIVKCCFKPGDKHFRPQDIIELKIALEKWKLDLPKEMKSEGLQTRPGSIWTALLHLAYDHLEILLDRSAFVRAQPNNKNWNGQIATPAATRITRIVENMLYENIIQFGQMHSITSIFAALCIHTINIKRSTGVRKTLAEHQAQICLLGLKEIQKYWKINNTILELFFEYLDERTLRRLRRDDAENALDTPHRNIAQGQDPERDGGDGQNNNTTQESVQARGSDSPQSTSVEQQELQPSSSVHPSVLLSQDQFFGVPQLDWMSDSVDDDFGLFSDPERLVDYGLEVQNFEILGRYL